MTTPRIRLHLGAHKTATTYLQARLELNAKLLASQGVAFWPINNVRPLFHQAWAESEGTSRSEKLKALSGRPTRLDKLGSKISSLFDTSDELLVSEENLLGETGEFLDGAFYPTAISRLQLLATFLPDRPLDIWLCIRSYPDFLASIYGEAIRFSPVPSPEQFASAFSSPQGAWLQIIDDIRDALPHANVFIWRYEDFRDLEPRILEGLSDVEAEAFEPLLNPTVRGSASDSAIRAMAETAEPLSATEWRFRMAALEHEYPVQSAQDRFSPWPEDQFRKMQQDYVSDISAIEARADITFIH
ncbi:hypothetical protein BMI86_14660 [Thioclava sp. DLFJ5-1]|nr:hypothetical protein BMI86_14660 [Thioclava sp. DLFJ5-1]